MKTKTTQAVADETLERYWKHSKSERWSWKNAAYVVSLLGADTPITHVNERTIDGLVSIMESKGLAGSTINRKLATLSKMLRHSYRMGYVSRIPSIERKKEPRGRIRWLRDDEEGQLLQAFRATDLAMYRFVVALLDTGARTGELLKLTRPDISSDVMHLWDTKNGRNRSIPLTTRAACALRDQAGVDHRLFTFTPSRFSKIWDKVRAGLGMTNDPQFVPHMLRHTCASRLVQRGVDLRVVQEWLGHNSITTTMRYSHLSPRQLMSARDVLEKNA